jgi:hypothetical protein
VAIAVPEISGSAITAMLGGFAGFVPRDGSLDDVISELDRVAAVDRNGPITVVAHRAVAAERGRADPRAAFACGRVDAAGMRDPPR